MHFFFISVQKSVFQGEQEEELLQFSEFSPMIHYLSILGALKKYYTVIILKCKFHLTLPYKLAVQNIVFITPDLRFSPLKMWN